MAVYVSSSAIPASSCDMRLNRISIIFVFKRYPRELLAFSLSLSFLPAAPRCLEYDIHKIVIANDAGECEATGIAFLFSTGGSNCLVLCAPSDSASPRARARKSSQ